MPLLGLEPRCSSTASYEQRVYQFHHSGNLFKIILTSFYSIVEIQILNKEANLMEFKIDFITKKMLFLKIKTSPKSLEILTKICLSCSRKMKNNNCQNIYFHASFYIVQT